MLTSDLQSDESMNANVMRLLSGVSAHGDQNLAEVEQDLVQMDVLLDEAIKKLCTSFMAIRQTIAMQQEVLNGMLCDGAPADEIAERLETIRAELSRHVGAAVTGLQFQDMTSQLIRRMAVHLASLRDVLGALDAHGAAGSESGDEAMRALLNQISDRVGAHVSEMEGGVRSTVNQRHMESGDIELF